MTPFNSLRDAKEHVADFIGDSFSTAIRYNHAAAKQPFNELALGLFAFQFRNNAPFRNFCVRRGVELETVIDWRGIPAVSARAFKEMELSVLPPSERTRVFHSSGTGGMIPSRHFHNETSLALYKQSILPGFQWHMSIASGCKPLMLFLIPEPARAPHSSLAHMAGCIQDNLAAENSVFAVKPNSNGEWILDITATLQCLNSACALSQPMLVLGTAFSFVHLLEFLTENNIEMRLPNGSAVMETGGYKGRSREMPREELHAKLNCLLGVSRSHIICEYGMCELGSQAYDGCLNDLETKNGSRWFQFPPWARVRIVNPETGSEAEEEETGLIQVFDLTNIASVIAVQTEDLGVRRAGGFELLGRTGLTESRGCSLMSA